MRDIVANLNAQTHKLYHLGVGRVARSSLARVNREQPHELYEALFWRLLRRCQASAPGHGFRFRNKLVSLDATYVDLCLEVFPWAQYRKTKGALKLHVGLVTTRAVCRRSCTSPTARDRTLKWPGRSGCRRGASSRRTGCTSTSGG